LLRFRRRGADRLTVTQTDNRITLLRRLGFLLTAVFTAALWCSGGASQGVDTSADVYRRALYPNGLPQRVNPFSNSKAQTEFALAARAPLPNTMREVIVYSERITKDLPLDKMYWVFIALVEKSGDTFRVLDRREVTDDLKLYTDSPGNFLQLAALVTPIAARNATVAAIELQTTLAGTGSISQGSHFFYVISPEATLALALTLEFTSESGRSGPQASAKIAILKAGIGAGVSGDVVLSTRSAEWNAFDSSGKAACGAVTTTRYRFTGSRYEQLPRAGTVSARDFVDIPVLPARATCRNR
jgi:hypothetical protein